MIRPFQGKSPRIHETVFVAETADVIGEVEVGEQTTSYVKLKGLYMEAR